MTWYPIGPDFIQQVRVAPFQRLSRRNYWGTMGRVRQVAFESGAGSEPETLYAAVNDTLDGQVGIFRKRADDAAWKAITDSLRSADNNVDPRCVATHPHFPQQVYVGTSLDQGFYRSANRGEAWDSRIPVPGQIRKIVVDPRPVASVADTVLYAATTTGLYRSASNGDSWALSLAGSIESFVLFVDTTGALFCYAGVVRSGLWFADAEPTSPAAWTNLSAAGIGLPAFIAGDATTPDSFDAILVDACARNPACAYAWITRPSFPGTGAPTGAVVGLYKTVAPRSSWTLVSASPTSGGAPLRSYVPLHRCFAVAPNSPGDGSNDILFFGWLFSHRSIDSGATWVGSVYGTHVDYMQIAFHPSLPAPGAIPDCYICNDGGVARSPRLADPLLDAGVPCPDAEFNAGEDLVPDSALFENLTFGLENCLVLGLTSNVFLPPCIGTWDNGVAVRRGPKGWTMFPGGFDGTHVEAAPTAGGTVVWTQMVDTSIGNIQGIRTFVDRGPETPPEIRDVYMEGTSDPVWTQSNFALDSTWRCLTGGQLLHGVTTLASDSGVGTGLVLNVVSTAEISDWILVRVGDRPGSVTDVTPTSFRFFGTIVTSLPAGTPVSVWRDAVVAIDAGGTGRRISQEFHLSSNLSVQLILVAAGGVPGTRRLAVIERDLARRDAPSLYRVDEAAAIPGPAVWDRISTDQPPSVLPTGLMVSRAGDVFVMLASAVAVDLRGTSIETPLFRVSVADDRWIPQRCDGFAPATFPDGTPHPLGPIAQDPLVDDVLYASQGGRVFRLTAGVDPDTWTWTLFSDGLPGVLVTTMAAGNVAPPGVAAVPLLRVATLGRGVWETALPGAATIGGALYMRRNFLDQGWSVRIIDGLPDPYRTGLRVWHWEGADIKVEIPQSGDGGTFYSSDPEATGVAYSDAATPVGTLDHVQFELLSDASQDIPSAARVKVHAQVQHRSQDAMGGVNVWMLWTRCGARLPLLDEQDDGGTFPFWDQFDAAGTITNRLPTNSRWKELAPPVTLEAIDVNHPRVASFYWDAPTVAFGEAGHYCVVAFVHGTGRPIGESARTSIDAIVMDNQQVCQKNLHVLAA
jgi:hypothetical protein